MLAFDIKIEDFGILAFSVKEISLITMCVCNIFITISFYFI